MYVCMKVSFCHQLCHCRLQHHHYWQYHHHHWQYRRRSSPSSSSLLKISSLRVLSSSSASSSSSRVIDACCQVVGCRLASPQRYRDNRRNIVGEYVHVDTASRHRAGKFRPESPTLEDYIVIPNVGHGAVEDCLTTGQLAFVNAIASLISHSYQLLIFYCFLLQRGINVFYCNLRNLFLCLIDLFLVLIVYHIVCSFVMVVEVKSHMFIFWFFNVYRGMVFMFQIAAVVQWITRLMPTLHTGCYCDAVLPVSLTLATDADECAVMWMITEILNEANILRPRSEPWGRGQCGDQNYEVDAETEAKVKIKIKNISVFCSWCPPVSVCYYYYYYYNFYFTVCATVWWVKFYLKNKKTPR